MTDHHQPERDDDAEPGSGAETAPGRGSGENPGHDPDPGSPTPAGMAGRWDRDHGAEVQRTSRGALPLPVIIAAIVIFAVGFYLFRRWRQQYVTYGVESSGELPAVLALLGLG